MSAVPAVLTFNAVDANGAEGIVADAQVAGELGCRALPVPTGLLVGGENGHPTIEKAPARWLEAAAASSARDGRPAAARIGLVTGAGQAEAIAAVLAQRAVPRVVCAPVARLAGEQILDRAALDTIRRSLHPLSSVVVIRAGDLEAHGGGSPEDLEAARGLAAAIRAGGAASVLLAGLGWRGRAIDLLDECGVVTVLDAPRLAAARVEGIAGAHAAALACHLARGLPLASAAAAAQRYVALRLQRGC